MRYIHEIIGSRAKIALLASTIDSSAHLTVSECATLSGGAISTTSLVLDEWQKAGFVKAEMIGPTKLITINHEHPLYKPIKELIHGYNEYLEKTIQTIQKNPVLQSPVILAALLYGSFARKDVSGQSDVDILIIAKKEDMELDEKLRKTIDEKIKTPVSIAWMTTTEISKRIKQKDKFIQNVFTQGKPLKGAEWIARTKRTL